jgi:CubicO group peptidase (beta-lactamase class C family)
VEQGSGGRPGPAGDWRDAGADADDAGAGACRAGAEVAALRGAGTVLGIDAGGSATRAVLVTGGVVTRTLTAAPFNYLLQDGGVRWLAEIIRDSGASAAGVGVPGIAREPGAARSFAAGLSAASGVPVRVASDATTAWLGAFGGGAGIAVIAGTGSVAVGGSLAAGDEVGDEVGTGDETAGGLARCGGYGYLVGDEGSGYWIGRKALRAALAAADGAGPPTALGEALAAATGATLDELIVRVHRDPRDRTILARLAPVVAACAARIGEAGSGGDEVAAAILAEAGAELAALAQALAARLAADGYPDLPVTGLGGVFRIDAVRAEFTRRTGAVPAQSPPELGAALLAARAAAGPADPGGLVASGGPVAPGRPGVAAVLAAAVAARRVPGAVLVTGRGEDVTEVVVVGRAQAVAGPERAMTRETIFDLASLTKVVATLPAVLRLADLGEVGLDEPVRRYLPPFAGDGRDNVTVRHLLTHTSGLPAELPLWRSYTGPALAGAALLAAPLERAPGAAVVYSDAGFMLLGRIVEAVTGAGLDAAVADLVTGPLGLTRTGFCPDVSRHGECAATEVQLQGAALSGVVHDENARMFGGVSGHAGLFAPADDIARYLARGWLDPDSPILSAKIRAAACRLQTAGTDGRRGLGWVLPGDSIAQFGSRWPETVVGHTGFTGTAMSFDPVSGAWLVLLTNDVHYGRGRGTIGPLRNAAHDACPPAA